MALILTFKIAILLLALRMRVILGITFLKKHYCVINENTQGVKNERFFFKLWTRQNCNFLAKCCLRHMDKHKT